MPDLPQLDDSIFLTDGGLETTLIFDHGLDLPDFAAFVLLADEAGRAALQRYYQPYLAIARDNGHGIVLDTPTWRASPDWAERLGYSPEDLAEANRAAVELVASLKTEAAVVVNGCVGPRGDGYDPGELLEPDEAQRYHAVQLGTFADTEADLVTAMTMTHTGEAIGFARAAAAAGLPSAVSFTVETDGRLPSGQSLREAVLEVDTATDGAPSYFMVNCAHPTHVEDALREGDDWQGRLRGLRANSSTMSHAELDAAEELDAGDPEDLGRRYAELRRDLPGLTVLGGCCGTTSRHVDAIRRAVVR